MGYSPQWDTWEPYENLTSCSEMIDKYVEDQKKQKENKQVCKKLGYAFVRDFHVMSYFCKYLWPLI